MPSLYWGPLAINALLFSLLGTVIASYFGVRILVARRQGKATDGLMAPFWIFAMAGLCAVLATLSHVLDRDLAAWILPWAAPAGSVAMAASILFAERLFGEGILSRRGRQALVLAMALFVAGEIAIAVARTISLSQGSVIFRDGWLRAPFALGFIVAPAFCLVNLRRALGPDGWSRVWPVLLNPVRPLTDQPDASAARGIFYFSLMPVALALVLAARSTGLLGWSVAETILSWLVLLVFSGFVWTFLSYQPERSGTTTKIAAMVLVAFLMIVSALSWMVAPAILDGFRDAGAPQAGQAYRFAPAADGGYDITLIEAQREVPLLHRPGPETEPIALPFDLPFLGQSHRTLYVRDTGLVGLGAFPRLQDIQFRYGPEAAIFVLAARLAPPPAPAADSGVFVDTLPGRVVISWAHMAIEGAPDQLYDAQLTLYPDGTLDIAFFEIPLHPRANIYRPDDVAMLVGLTPGSRHGPVLAGTLSGRHLPPGTGAVDDRRPAFYKALNAAFGPMAAFLLLAVPGLLILFSLLLQLSVQRPLAALALGVERFRKGNLGTPIPVYAQDEIGALARAFNEVAAERERLLQSLEAEVERRSAEAVELSARNARLEERADLGRELHDAVSQSLFAASLIADSLPRLVLSDPAKAADASGQVAALNRAALAETRNLLMHLRSHEMLAQPFGALLRGVAQEMARSYGLAVTVSVDSDAQLPDAVQYAFFRVAHAALTNVARHAGTDSAEARFDAVDGQAMLSVTDNGAGFDPDAVPPGHYGLAIMRERLDKLGGMLEVETAPGRGCRITAIWFSDDSGDGDSGDAG